MYMSIDLCIDDTFTTVVLCSNFAYFIHRNGKLVVFYIQGDHLSGKPGNVGEFDICQGFY